MCVKKGARTWAQKIPRQTSLACPICHRRLFSTKQSFHTPQGSFKVDLESKNLIGIAQSRGERPYQEDFCSVYSLNLPTRDLRQNLRDTENRDAISWRPHLPGQREPKTQQVACFGIFDGHGGDEVSRYLKSNLHELIENVDANDVTKVVEEYRNIGGYFRRFKGGVLQRIATGDETDLARFGFALDQRATMAFLEADNHIIHEPDFKKAGAVATVALLHSLDVPANAFFASSSIALTLAHVGDTRAILCEQAEGKAVPMTVLHHPDSRSETSRLQRVGAGLVTDSFGEIRLGGSLANSRGFGDKRFKRMGVTAEPSISKRVLNGSDYCFLVLATDGISGFMTDQEVVDLVRGQSTPSEAAEAIVSFAEQIGSDDNMTCVVIPLPAWNKQGGEDETKARRDFRLNQMQGGGRARRQ